MTSMVKVLPQREYACDHADIYASIVKVIIDNVPPSSRAKSVGAPMDIHKPLRVIPA